MFQDTISAVSTPRGKGGVAVIRISGHDALAIADRVFKPANAGVPLKDEPRKARLGTILAPCNGAGNTWTSVDQGLALFFPGPSSFTGEDVVELHCHGGALLTETILSATFVAGARAATAGEFTRRAFLNGKMKLTEAEALGMMLEASTESQIQLASTILQKGSPLSHELNLIYDELVLLLSTAYAQIDYPDEDLGELSPEECLDKINSVEERLESLLSTFQTGHAVIEGIETVLCGRTNVGKSSVYNRLVGSEQAIVTNIPGTTRDILVHQAVCGDVLLNLNDTAGIRESDPEDPVEKIGISRALSKLGGAELILAVFDASSELTEADHAVVSALKSTMREHPSQNIMILLNKCDLPVVVKEETITALFDRKLPIFLLSTLTGEGWDHVTDYIQKAFIDGSLNLNESAIVMNARQHACLLSALEAVRRGKASLIDGITFDVVSSDLEEALEALKQTDGRSVSEDIVASIFSHFCVGK